MSDLQKRIAISHQDGVIRIVGKNERKIMHVGCTTDTSLEPMEVTENLLIYNAHENGDLIVIGVEVGPTFKMYILEINIKDATPIDLEKPYNKPWIPKSDRIIQTFDNGFMRIKIDDEWFSTDLLDRAKGHRILPVSAGNLMVKYAYGLAEAKEIVDLAEEIQTQADAVEMLEVEKAKNALLRQQIREHENCISEFMCDNIKITTALVDMYIPIYTIEHEAGCRFANKKEIKSCATTIKEKITEIEKLLGK